MTNIPHKVILEDQTCATNFTLILTKKKRERNQNLYIHAKVLI